MEFKASGIVIEVRLEQPKNAYNPIVVNDKGISIELNDVQFSKARSPNDTTVAGNSTRSNFGQELNVYVSIVVIGPRMTAEVNSAQPENTELPITLTDSGIVTEVKEHPLKAVYPIETTELGMSIDVNAEHPSKAEEPIEVTDSGIFTDVSDSQRVNRPSLIDVKELGRTIDERDTQAINALRPIVVTEFGISKDVRLWQTPKV